MSLFNWTEKNSPYAFFYEDFVLIVTININEYHTVQLHFPNSDRQDWQNDLMSNEQVYLQ